MNKNAVYICGLQEKKSDVLSIGIKNIFVSMGYKPDIIELYADTVFGSYSIFKEIEIIENKILQLKPEMICAHSLGAYTLLQADISVNTPIILIDPSLSAKDIFSNNKNTYSSEFVQSCIKAPPIEIVATNNKLNDIEIFGAGRGGYKIAERYNSLIPNSHYLLFPEADHNFTHKQSLQTLLDTIKKRLETISSRH